MFTLKVAVALENVEDARIMLSRAVECVPQNVDLWLALARLSTYTEARSVLNRARNAVPTDVQIWISAAMLEEAHVAESGNDAAAMARTIIHKAIRSLQKRQVVMDRTQWLSAAEGAEEAGAPLTAAAIVQATIDVGVEAQVRDFMYRYVCISRILLTVQFDLLPLPSSSSRDLPCCRTDARAGRTTRSAQSERAPFTSRARFGRTRLRPFRPRWSYGSRR